MPRKVYGIENLDCAACAAKLEREIQKIPGVEEATITFATEQLRITAEDPDALLSEIRRVAAEMEPDVTVSDFVADARASTPSNAAEIAVPDQMELLRWLRGAQERLLLVEETKLERCRRRLDELSGRRVLRDQMASVQDRRMLLAHLQQRLGDLSARSVGEKRRAFSALAASLDAMSPLKVLGRGYAVVRNGQGIVKSYRDAPAGSHIEVALGEGALECTVEKGRA